MSELADEIRRAASYRTALRRFLARTELVAAAAGLSSQRYNLLLVVKAGEVSGEPVTVSRLKELLELRQTAASELVRRAEQAGLVARTRSPADGRMSLIALTPEGERRLMQAFRDLRADRAELARSFRELGREFRALPPVR
jgi:DNA-binding MarR family transcriptional regulator